MDISSRIPLIDETARNQDSAIAQAITAGFRGFLADDDYRKPTETVEDLTDAISLLHQYARDGNLPSLIDILNKHPEIVNAGDEAEKVTALHYAARYGRYKIVQVLLDRGADGNAINSEMMTPLHMAAKFCKTEASVSTAREEKTPRLKHTSRSLPEGTPEDTDEPPVKRVIYRLIKAGVMRDPMTLYNMTPLHYAAMKDNLAAAEALVEMGARINPDLNEPDSEKMVPALLTACTYGSDSVALFLLGKGADLAVVRPGDRSTAFHIAAFHGKDQTLASLLHKAGPRKHEFLQQSNADEMTPFCLAVEGGNPETAKLILQHIGSINPDGKEQWLLHTAAEKGNLDVVKVLIEAKADPKKEDRNKHLPIHLAAMGNHVAVIRYLVELDKTCVDAPDHQGMTPLLLAATSSRSSDAVKVLVEEFGADMGKRDNEGRSIVYVASKYSAIQSLEYILDKLEATCPILPRQMTLRNFDIACPGITLKTLIDLPDHSQMTPMHLVCGNGYLETVQILYSRGASLEKLNEDEETPLHLAARGGRTETVRTLLGWDKSLVGAKEEMGNTPLHLAAKCGRDQSVNLLLDAGADINSRNEKNETPLYLAASYGHDVVVRIFVERNVDMNVETESGSALHEAARRGHHDVVRTLIEKRNHKREPLVDVTKRWNGKTALQIAIEAGHRDTARVFVECQEWEALMTGQETLPLTGNNEPRQSAMRELIQHFPDVAIAVFENCIIHKCDGSDYNFTLLDDTYMLKNEEGLLQADIDVFMSAEEGGKLKPEAKTYSQNPDAIYQNHPLKLIAASERMSLLSHPLVLTLIKYKWNSLGRYVYYSALMIYLTFICLFTAFVILSPAPFNIYDENKNESLDLSEALRYSTFACPDIKIAPTGSLMALKVIIIILSVAQMCKEIFQMAHRRIAYMTLDNLIEWFIYVSVVMTVWDFCPCSESTGVRMTWQWILAAAAVFACWINLLLMIRKLPRFGIYVVMFFDIFRTFCRFFIIFVLFIIAFSVTFYVLLQNRPEFSTPMSAVLKTTVMMIGEFEFTAIFHGDPNEHVERLFGHGLAYPIFFVFCIVMTILLMNLLVGLAVGDIMQVQEKAELRRLCMQIDLVLQIEATMPWVREKTIRGRFRVFTIKNKTTWNKMLRFFGKKFGFESPIEEPTQVTRSEEEERILELREEQRAQRAQISQIQSNVDFMYQKQVEFESLLKSLLRHHNVPFVETAEQKQQ